MVESLFKRAKAFIGLEEEGEVDHHYGQQLDMNTILKSKKDSKIDSTYSVIYYEPKVYEDSLNISIHLRGGAPVVINLKHLDPAEGTRLIDFVCGTAYAINGHMMKIGESIFLFTPSNIAITSADERSALGEEMAYDEEQREAFFSR
ncbi:cell division protein SepF [Candidatus Saganbacteria bacterium CG08_land_8_20_14_0_20_45_16]|uniref:Cell division protein SepF n=1 Tax=Candidatus Saganbacteria bacterium CG08_land_8_20_14_0_20_45_16 TaxID=2014293 RepID=A0A2H0XT05_UNCSA|nr:MAG: cell division protein SepF [Candidatus Saganbacteria bacterium CG08_land_8_20_14_0_20_45_16]